MSMLFASLGRAIVSQLHVRMLLLTLAPFLISVVLWGVILWQTLQPLIDWIQDVFSRYDGFRIAGDVLGTFGLDALKVVLVPHIAMWMLLPLMILTALVFIGALAMPAISRHVGDRHYPMLEKRRGGSISGSLWIALSSFLVFIALWVITVPLTLIPLLGFLIHPLLWGWLTCRVIAYDALAEHADAQERREIMRRYRWPLLMIGTAAGALGTVPAVLWLGGVLSVILFPLLAAISIWLYVLVFTFSGLWFQHYCLAVLADYRQENGRIE
ncbi:MAG TPA: EI24 domain-containing protein [Paucimonas sp.]|nr:EI24 domain-containing protein [Paucimonas sp.]